MDQQREQAFKMQFPGMAEKINAQMAADGYRADDLGQLECVVTLTEDRRQLLLHVSYGEWAGTFPFPDWFLPMARAVSKEWN